MPDAVDRGGIVEETLSNVQRQVRTLAETLEVVMERDPEQEVQGMALPVLDAVIAAVRDLYPQDPMMAVVRDAISPESIAAGEPIRAVDALLVARQLEAVVGIPPAEDAEGESRVLCTLTPKDLVALADGVSSIQAAAMIEPYLGTWLTVRGKVRDVKEDRRIRSTGIQHLSVSINGPKSISVVFRMGADETRRASLLTKGQTVTLAGRILRINSMVTCEPGEFVD